MAEKKCSKCGGAKEINEFYKDISKQSGYRSHCKSCILRRRKQYRKENKDEITKYRTKYYRERRKNDVNFKLITNLRRRLAHALKKNHKSASTLVLSGCSIGDLREHIQSQFICGMSWENREEWHIDHIIPCTYFDLSISEEQKKCFHWSNLQPMWVTENLKKHESITHLINSKGNINRVWNESLHQWQSA